MKKWKIILAIIGICIIIALTATCLSSCNKQLVDTNYTYTNAYIKVGEEWTDVEIKQWKDYNGEQLQLTLKDGSSLLVSSVNCILYKGSLPKEK